MAKKVWDWTLDLENILLVIDWKFGMEKKQTKLVQKETRYTVLIFFPFRQVYPIYLIWRFKVEVKLQIFS